MVLSALTVALCADESLHAMVQRVASLLPVGGAANSGFLPSVFLIFMVRAYLRELPQMCIYSKLDIVMLNVNTQNP
jgi:hypothetical protein